MPNYCDYQMLLRGKKKDVLLFAKWLSRKETDPDEHPVHKIGYRIFEAYFAEEDLKDNAPDETVDLNVNGYCAWSCYSCMMEGPHTYHKDCKGAEDAPLSVPEACSELGVTCEIYSSEPGFAFAEHFLVAADGSIELNEEADYEEIFVGYDTWEDYLKDNEYEECDNLPITRDEFDAAQADGEDYITHCEWGTDWLWQLEQEKVSA